jgi:uncharacterized protein
MTISPFVTDAVIAAEARALATSGPAGINVVPVSVVEVTDTSIYLFDFFMNKTVENICLQPDVALVVWKGLTGVQIKATAQYVTDGDIYDSYVISMKVMYPGRTLRGVLVLTPTSVYDVSAGPTAGQSL